MTAACTCSATGVPDIRYSVHVEGHEEAQRHKWIESEKAGRDLGESAIRSWVQKHWNGFLRARWIDHLEGRAFWIELDHDDFGLLQRAFQGSQVFDEILWHLKCGWENLDVILWARARKLLMEEVISILEQLDINSRRIEFELENRLTQAAY